MSRFLNTGLRFLGQPQFIGRGRPIQSPVGATLDATLYEGAAIYGSDGQFYYSDGVQWRIPTGVVDIARPSALPPTNSEEAMKLRLTQFFSPRGLTQTGVFFEVAASQDGFDNPILTRDITSTTASEYQTIYPGDGLAPGQEFWWRGLYTGTEGGQSEFSVPFRQVYPDLIDDPDPVTPEGATTGAVELTAYNSTFGLSYVETQIEFWEAGSDPEVDPPVETVTSVNGALVLLPGTLTEGAGYIWRGRYGGRVGGAGPVTYTDWTTPRTVLNGAASMILVFDPVKAQNRTITLPLGVYGGLVDVLVDWGDGSTQTVQSGGGVSHTYATGDDSLKVVTISGQLEQYGGNANIQGLIRVDNIGFKLGLTSLREMFRNCTTNTTYVNPALPPQVTDGSSMFYVADPGFDVGALDVSNIQNFYRMFYAADFNGPLPWDTSSATDMSWMFGRNDVFDDPSIGAWNVSNVTDFSYMFAAYNASSSVAFNQDIGGWDVSNAVTMEGMFGQWSSAGAGGTSQFNNGGSPSINDWNVSNVTNMSGMFGRTRSGPPFNQPLDKWDVSNVTDFSYMFMQSHFNQPLTGWNLSSATNVSDMFRYSPFNNDVTGWVLPASISGLFYGATSFNHPSVTTWDTSGVTDMSNLFVYAKSFNQPIGVWDTSSVTDTSGMFYGAESFNQPIANWNTSSVTDMSRMFYNSTYNMIFNQPIESWDVSKVQTFEEMFYNRADNAASGRQEFNQPLGGWNVSAATNFNGMFSSKGGARIGYFNQDLSAWGLNVSGASLQGFFNSSSAISTENYSRLLVGWANTVQAQSGPFSVSADFFQTYNSTVYDSGGYVTNAVDARAFLTRSRRVLVASASTADADGDFLWNGTTQQFEKANGWHFFDNGTAWELRDDTDTVQATAQDATMPDQPYKVATWDGVLSSATVDLNGMGWTITDGGAV